MVTARLFPFFAASQFRSLKTIIFSLPPNFPFSSGFIPKLLTHFLFLYVVIFLFHKVWWGEST
jgi:hypothetical protein